MVVDISRSIYYQGRSFAERKGTKIRKGARVHSASNLAKLFKITIAVGLISAAADTGSSPVPATTRPSDGPSLGFFWWFFVFRELLSETREAEARQYLLHRCVEV